SGAISEQHLLELVQREVPATVQVDLRVGRRRLREDTVSEPVPDMPYTVEGQIDPDATTEEMDALDPTKGTPPPPPGSTPPGANPGEWGPPTTPRESR
ncbi:MAG TPA: hypothetical protein VNN79_01170, partial [Actinomycetota bacterium]|nr:hypothetical protein [Actinomycetota bacterium]